MSYFCLFEVLILLGILVISSAQQTGGQIKCFQCASAGLKARWELTGFPRTLSDSDFTSSCDDNTAGVTTTCNGPCMTYIIQDPDNITTNGQFFFVRGCHSTITQVVANLQALNFDNTKKYCEHDSQFKRANTAGNIVSTQLMIEFCQDNNCNNRISMPGQNGNANDCTGQNWNNTINNQVLSCYECSANSWDCETGTCSKKYCMKSIINVHGRYTTRKWCSNVNPFGVNEVCQSNDITLPSFYNTISAYATQCYCKDRQYCNSAITSKSTFIFTLVPIFFLFVVL